MERTQASTPPASLDPGNFVNFTTSFVSPYDNPTLLFSGFNNNSSLFVDDVSIQTQASQGVPEPSAMVVFLALGGLFLGSSLKRAK